MKLQQLFEGKPRVYRNTMLGDKTQRVYNVAYDNKLVAHITFDKGDDAWYWKMYEVNNRFPKSGVEHSKRSALAALTKHLK
jgi:hypothetical protein